MNLNDKRASAYGTFSSSKNIPSSQKQSSVQKSTSVQKTSPLRKFVSEQNEVKSQNGILSQNHSNEDDVLFKVPAQEQNGKESVYRRVAKFLIILGVEQSAKVLQLLTPEQIEKIVPELASIRSVSPEEKEVILAEFEGLANQTMELGGKQTAFTILEKAYGADKAEEMISKAAPYSGSKPFDYFSDCDIEKIFLLLNDESAGIQALVLSHIEPKKAASVINKMKPEVKKDVVRHLANLGSINPEFLKRVDQAMHEKADSIQNEKSEHLDGRNALAEILKKMSPGSEQSILSSLAEDDPELGLDLKQRLFTLDDVLNADERFIQEYLSDKKNIEIVYLIAGKNPDYREKILACVSKGRRSQILDEENVSRPIAKKNCDEATEKFIKVLRGSYEKGHLIIRGRNDEDYV